MAIIFLYLALLAIAFFLLIVRPQRRQLAARRALIASLEVGDEVITAGGIFGTILAMSDTELTIAVAPGVELRFAREAVSARPVPAADPSEESADLRSGGDPADPTLGDGDQSAGDD